MGLFPSSVKVNDVSLRLRTLIRCPLLAVGVDATRAVIDENCGPAAYGAQLRRYLPSDRVDRVPQPPPWVSSLAVNPPLILYLNYPPLSQIRIQSSSLHHNMEVFFSNLDFRATSMDVERVFASVLHSPNYLPPSKQLWNFHISLFPPKKNRPGQTHGGRGTVAVPEEDLGHLLLDEFGGTSPTYLTVGRRMLRLEPSRGKVKVPILEKIRREPYIPPEARQRLEGIKESFQVNTVGIRTLQLGWETRSGVFSVEWEKNFQRDCCLIFNDTRREVRIKLMDEQQYVVRSIAIQWSRISWSAIGYTEEGHPSIFLSLNAPPAFDIGDSFQRQRLLSLYPDDPDLIRVLPYATLCIRLLCHTTDDLETFKGLCKVARLPLPKDFAHQAEHLELFSETKLEQFHQWTSTLHWPVAFQLEALLQGRLADTKEVLSIRRFIDDMVARKGVDYTADFLRCVINDPDLVLDDHEGGYEASIKRYAEDFSPALSHPWDPMNGVFEDGIFHCFHLYISPTSMKLRGPFPERSNRVMRTYAENHYSFIRVSFVEENDLRYQQDREIDGPAFIGLWVSPILRNGITVAGRQYKFLAYSQSALKSHTVWFVKDFINPRGEPITATEIIAGLGKFDCLEYDSQLKYCPARYAARISQAFTTTDSSVSVTAEEILTERDIIRGSYCFTDGVGSISPQLAKKIWRALQKRGTRSTRNASTHSRAFQIRLVGAKGMLSVNYKLSGNVVVLRDSMIKFDAPHSTDVEIAQVFARPSKYYMNRALIMILEGLGVPYEVFRDLQDAAVQDVEDAVTSLEKAAKTLDQFGLAASYRMSSILRHLSKLGLSPSDMDDFYDQMLSFSIHHILRDLKQYARIPVNEGYTLVGVADIHSYLQEGEVFACVTVPDTDEIYYLEGPVLVSRSPIIHPGDVQVVHAIGLPPGGSPFQNEPLVNTIVFSVNGIRPLPSCLGGGDLDGDIYNVTNLQALHPPKNYPPAAYIPAQRKVLTRPSTMEDVADFVVDYINSDILGMVSTNWMMIADLHDIFHEDCIKLCQIHSDAVDYAKNGTAVSPDTVPKPKSSLKPDWHAPETVDLDEAIGFYPSQKAIGKLFRRIDLQDLPEVQMRSRAGRRKRQHVHDDAPETDLDELFAALCMEDRLSPLELAMKDLVSEFIDPDPSSKFVRLAIESLSRYSMELQGICACNAIQPRKDAMLSEEEAVIGTIVAKCPQRRKRKEATAQLREQTSYLVKSVRDELSGDDDTSQYEWLEIAWAAWKVSRHLKDSFGGHSYGWIALGEVFDAMRAIEPDVVSSSQK